ncbi:hypothetical protein ILUMI_26164 [Ignelater luminosus]|uniref:ascorbate ferrireductase (transmembrane) n=1 Tax=Ignelater luminosus TaxID=2038154 RepID=A0A8K0FZD2_IGNLU|nr:hypothetical protein ILUMI_26164 [Ignelater luminosus]
MVDDTSLDTVIRTTKRIFNTVFHQCIAVVFVYVICVPIESYSNPFSWHVILSTLGILPFAIEALILFSNDNVWSQEISRKQKYWVHGILISIGCFFIITGISIEINRKNQRDLSHFISAHAITGLTAMIFLICALICGPMVFYATIFSKWIPPVWLKLIHNVLGQLGYILAIICLCLGYYTNWFSRHTSKSSKLSITIATVLIMLWSLFNAWKSIVNQIKSILR